MTTATTDPSDATDTMTDIADALDDAADTLDESLLSDGNDIGEFASKTVYSTFYYFSYGVCFVGLLAGKLIPKTGVVGQGLRDGAAAAHEAVERMTDAEHALDGDFDAPITLEEEPEGESSEVPMAKTAEADLTDHQASEPSENDSSEAADHKKTPAKPSATRTRRTKKTV